MARINWNDIEQNETLDQTAMSQARGGFGLNRHLFYRPAFRAPAGLANPSPAPLMPLGTPTFGFSGFHVASSVNTSLLRHR